MTCSLRNSRRPQAVLDPAGLQGWLDTWPDGIAYDIAKLTIAVTSVS